MSGRGETFDAFLKSTMPVCARPNIGGAKISARRRRLSSQHFSAPDLSRSVDMPPQKTRRGQNRIALTLSLSAVFAKPKTEPSHSQLSPLHSSHPSHHFPSPHLSYPTTPPNSLPKS